MGVMVRWDTGKVDTAKGSCTHLKGFNTCSELHFVRELALGQRKLALEVATKVGHLDEVSTKG